LFVKAAATKKQNQAKQQQPQRRQQIANTSNNKTTTLKSIWISGFPGLRTHFQSLVLFHLESGYSVGFEAFPE